MISSASVFATRRGVAVLHVVQVDLRQACRAGELLEPARDGVRMRRLAVLPAEQHPVILVIQPELFPLPVQHLDVRVQVNTTDDNAPPVARGRDGQAREARRVRSRQRARPVKSRRAIRASRLSHGCSAPGGMASIQA